MSLKHSVKTRCATRAPWKSTWQQPQLLGSLSPLFGKDLKLHFNSEIKGQNQRVSHREANLDPRVNLYVIANLPCRAPPIFPPSPNLTPCVMFLNLFSLWLIKDKQIVGRVLLLLERPMRWPLLLANKQHSCPPGLLRTPGCSGQVGRYWVTRWWGSEKRTGEAEGSVF